MSISTVGNVGGDLARIQDKQNRDDSKRVSAKPDAAPASQADAASTIDVDAARRLTEAENLRAAESTLTDADVDNAPSPQEHVQTQAREALAAQTNKLPPQLLQLLNE